MMQEIHRERQRLDHVFTLAGRVSQDEELLSHWARYLCVLTSGFLENALRIMFSDHVKRHADPRIARYSQRYLQRLGNVNDQQIRELLGAFSADWRVAFEAAVTDAQKDAVDSVVANRNSISHGLPVGITFIRVKEYYGHVAKVVEWIAENCAAC